MMPTYRTPKSVRTNRASNTSVSPVNGRLGSLFKSRSEKLTQGVRMEEATLTLGSGSTISVRFTISVGSKNGSNRSEEISPTDSKRHGPSPFAGLAGVCPLAPRRPDGTPGPFPADRSGPGAPSGPPHRPDRARAPEPRAPPQAAHNPPFPLSQHASAAAVRWESETGVTPPRSVLPTELQAQEYVMPVEFEHHRDRLVLPLSLDAHLFISHPQLDFKAK